MKGRGVMSLSFRARAKELKKYVQDTLDIALVIQPWNDFSDLPFFLKDQYVFYRSRIMATPWTIKSVDRQVGYSCHEKT
jgi:hypothetical protein